MTKSVKEILSENEEVSIEKSGFKCYNCGVPDFTVYLDEGDCQREWPYCNNCGANEKYLLSGLANRGIDINDAA